MKEDLQIANKNERLLHCQQWKPWSSHKNDQIQTPDDARQWAGCGATAVCGNAECPAPLKGGVTVSYKAKHVPTIRSHDLVPMSPPAGFENQGSHACAHRCPQKFYS